METDVRTELPFPFVPDSLYEPSKRSDYAVSHYWEALDLQRKYECLDTAFMEQSFSNFTALLPYASEEVRKEAAKKLIDRCRPDADVLRLVAWVAHKYLDDPNSPMRSEDFYIPFLECFSAGGDGIPEDIREKAKFRLEQAMKNRPGSKSPNFKVVLRDGKTADLYSLLGGGENIVMFYDSDCEHCKEISERLAEMPLKEGVAIIAIDVAGDRSLWDEKKASLPAEWTVGFDLDNIEERELFYLPALPTFYILDASGIIIAKDPMI
ncbi:MAG: DUF5106 domain-containing protein [Muribaculaceae bacterium]|nr:DUF5106 domain-containing protein [Muribaculaceae bacterium]